MRASSAGNHRRARFAGVALVDSTGLELLLDAHERIPTDGRRHEAGQSRSLVSRSAQGDGRGSTVRDLSTTPVVRCGVLCNEYVDRFRSSTRPLATRNFVVSVPVLAAASAGRATLGQQLDRRRRDHVRAARSGAGRRFAEGPAAGRNARRNGHGPGRHDPALHRSRTWACQPRAAPRRHDRSARRAPDSAQPCRSDSTPIALFRVRDAICVAMADPQNLEQVDEIERITQSPRAARVRVSQQHSADAAALLRRRL